MTREEKIHEEASAWLVRQQGDTADWGGFTAWLEADPRHRLAYDSVALVDAELDTQRDLLKDGPAGERVAANDQGPRFDLRWAGWGGGAIAAALALTFAFQPQSSAIPSRDYRAPATRSAHVKLADGSQILLAPSSQLRVRGDQLALQGAGYFDVPHQPGRTLEIQAGDFVLTDIGTRFSVENINDNVKVEVAEGTVSVTSSRLASRLALSSGHGLIADAQAGTVRRTSVNASDVGAWRTGKLEFDAAPLALVARDVTRYSGRKVTVDPAIADQPFSGVIAIDDGASPGTTIAQIMALRAHSVGDGIRLEPRR